MQADPPPTVILFDNDLMAVAALSTLTELGVAVPGQVSLLAWDDSALCEITHPQLSAMSHDVMGFGAHVGRRLFGLLDGAEPAAYLDSTPRLVVRASTAGACNESLNARGFTTSTTAPATSRPAAVSSAVDSTVLTADAAGVARLGRLDRPSRSRASSVPAAVAAGKDDGTGQRDAHQQEGRDRQAQHPRSVPLHGRPPFGQPEQTRAARRSTRSAPGTTSSRRTSPRRPAPRSAPPPAGNPPRR